MFACAWLHAGSGQARTLLYGVTFWSGELVRIDLQTGVSTPIGTLANSYDIAVFDGALYTFHGNAVRQVDDGTGQVLRTMSFPNSIPGGEGAFAWRSDGFAFGTRSANTTGTLFRLDFASSDLVPLTAQGGLTPSLDGLAFDSTGDLYGLQQNFSGDYGLYRVNATDGRTTLIGRLGVSLPSASGAVAGLAFAPDGSLFAAVGNQSESRLCQVNKSTGAAISVRTLTAPGISGIAFLTAGPGPLTIAKADDQILISWPHRFGGLLQTASTLTASWQPWTASSVATNSLEAWVLTAPTGTEGYFRLVE